MMKWRAGAWPKPRSTWWLDGRVNAQLVESCDWDTEHRDNKPTWALLMSWRWLQWPSMSVVATNSVKPSYNDVAHLTLILWAYSCVLLRETWSRIRLCMSRVLSAKLTDKHLSIMTLIVSWSTTCMYALFAFDPRQCFLLPIIQFRSPSAWDIWVCTSQNQEL
jgi:hypothetical protein